LPDILSGIKSVAFREISKHWNKVLQEHAGTEVSVTNRGEVVAYLRVLSRKKGQKVQMPDFNSRIKARFGNRTLSTELVRWLDEVIK
jgi:antitoxin (DNA-binding transcriptional repressor) of toxin-antitoxin stability system